MACQTAAHQSDQLGDGMCDERKGEKSRDSFADEAMGNRSSGSVV